MSRNGSVLSPTSARQNEKRGRRRSCERAPWSRTYGQTLCCFPSCAIYIVVKNTFQKTGQKSTKNAPICFSNGGIQAGASRWNCPQITCFARSSTTSRSGCFRKGRRDKCQVPPNLRLFVRPRCSCWSESTTIQPRQNRRAKPSLSFSTVAHGYFPTLGSITLARTFTTLHIQLSWNTLQRVISCHDI